MIEVDRAPGIAFCRIFACMSVASFLSFASFSPTPHLHLFFFLFSFCFPRKEKGAVHRVAILWIWCCPNTLLSTFVLRPCVTVCILILWLRFLLANYPAFPSIYLLMCSCIPFYSAGSIFQPSKHLVSHPFPGWPQARRSVLSAGLPAGEALCWASRPSQSLASLNGAGAWGWGASEPFHLSCQRPTLARCARWSPPSASNPHGGQGDIQATFLVRACELKMDLIQTLRSGMQPYSQFNSLFSEENGLPLSMIINEFTFKCCHIRWQTRSLSLIELEPKSTCILRGRKLSAHPTLWPLL